MPDAVAGLREAAARAALEAGCVEDQVDAVRLAVSEAATNAVLHAFAPGAPGEVRLDVDLDDGTLVVVVEDDGWGMRPRADSPGAGLGLPVISKLATRVDIGGRDGGGTAIRMHFGPLPRHV